MNLWKIKCALFGHNRERLPSPHGVMSGFAVPWRCLDCDVSHEGLKYPPVPPMPSNNSSDTWDVIEQCIKEGVNRGRITVNQARKDLGNIAEERARQRTEVKILSDRIRVDDAKDIVTIDGHRITGEALSFFTSVTPPGRSFRIVSAEPGDAIVIMSMVAPSE